MRVSQVCRVPKGYPELQTWGSLLFHCLLDRGGRWPSSSFFSTADSPEPHVHTVCIEPDCAIAGLQPRVHAA